MCKDCEEKELIIEEYRYLVLEIIKFQADKIDRLNLELNSAKHQTHFIAQQMDLKEMIDTLGKENKE